MSGEAGGIVLVPILAIGALPLIGAVLVGGAIIGGIGAAGRAVANYESKKRQKRQAIRQSGVYQSIGSFRQEMAANMQEQTRLNVETSERMVAVMNENRRKMAEILQSDSPDKYEKYIEIIRENSTKTTKAMAEMQESFIRNYHTKINRSVEKVSAMVSDEYKKGMEELKQLQSDRAKKQQKAKEMADRFIEEAKILLEALEKQFDGAKFSYRQMAELTKTLNESIEQYSHENYESAIATAKNVVVEVVDEIYKADCAKQEWENYYKIALVLSAEVDAYLDAQKVITEEIKNEAEEKLGKKLEEDIVGIEICDYCGTMQNGENQYVYLKNKVEEIRTFLESDKAGQLSTEQLKEYIEVLNNKLYTSAATIVHRAILNMNNAFSRQNISEEIVNFFEDHDFTFKGYSYENDRHDGTLFIGLENDITGEEIVVTLAPEVQSNGDVQTRVNIDQLKGDETNEERKQYYRDSIQKVVCDSTPGAQVRLECKKGTRNKLSQRTDLRNRIKES